MSSAPEVAKASAALRSAHQSLVRIVRDSGDDHAAWERATALQAWTSDIVERLRVASTPAGLARTRRRGPLQAAGFKVLLLTWRLPAKQRPGPPPEAAWRGDSEALIRAHREATAAWLEFLERQAAHELRPALVVHPEYGDLDGFEWARLAAIVGRSCEAAWD